MVCFFLIIRSFCTNFPKDTTSTYFYYYNSNYYCYYYFYYYSFATNTDECNFVTTQLFANIY